MRWSSRWRHAARNPRAGTELARKAIHEHEEVDRLLSGPLVVYPDDRFPMMYGRLLAASQRSGRAVASMDLLIATAAVIDDAALVTRNVTPGLWTLDLGPWTLDR